MKRFYIFLQVFIISFSTHAQSPTNGLVAYYPFNGNANDESGSGNHGNAINSTMQADRLGSSSSNSYSFGISGDNLVSGIVISNSQSLQFTNSFTFSFWAKGGNPSELNFYFSKDGSLKNNRPPSYSGDGDGIKCGLVADPLANKLIPHFSIDSQGIVSGYLSYNYQIWNNYIITSENNLTKLFLNGNLINQKIENLDLSYANTRDLIIGSSKVYSNSLQYLHKFKGEIDDFRVYNRALSDNEVQQLYQSELPLPNIYIYYLNIPTEVRQGEDAKVTIKATVTKQ